MGILGGIIGALVALFGVIRARVQQTKVELKLRQREEIMGVYGEYLSCSNAVVANNMSYGSIYFSEYLEMGEKAEALRKLTAKADGLVLQLVIARNHARIMGDDIVKYKGMSCNELVSSTLDVFSSVAESKMKMILPPPVAMAELMAKLKADYDANILTCNVSVDAFIEGVTVLKKVLDDEIESIGSFREFLFN